MDKIKEKIGTLMEDFFKEKKEVNDTNVNYLSFIIFLKNSKWLEESFNEEKEKYLNSIVDTKEMSNYLGKYFTHIEFNEYLYVYPLNLQNIYDGDENKCSIKCSILSINDDNVPSFYPDETISLDELKENYNVLDDDISSQFNKLVELANQYKTIKNDTFSILFNMQF